LINNEGAHLYYIIIFFQFFFSTSFAISDDSGFKRYKYPEREFSIIATDSGYYPSNIVIFKGEKVTLFVSAAMNENSCLVVESKGIFLAAVKGKVSEAKMVFDEAGEYTYYCPGQKNALGKITVLGQEFNPTVALGRTIASESKEEMDRKQWKPKDE
jgi:plastocyanin